MIRIQGHLASDYTIMKYIYGPPGHDIDRRLVLLNRLKKMIKIHKSKVQ